MTDEMKEFLLVWTGILIMVGIVSKLVHNLYTKTLFSLIAKHTGDSLALVLFWVGWLFLLLLIYNIVMNLYIYEGWRWRVEDKIKELEEEKE